MSHDPLTIANRLGFQLKLQPGEPRAATTRRMVLITLT